MKSLQYQTFLIDRIKQKSSPKKQQQLQITSKYYPQNINTKIEPYRIVIQISHSNKKQFIFCDYIAIKQVLLNENTKNISISNHQPAKLNTKKQLYLLCRINSQNFSYQNKKCYLNQSISQIFNKLKRQQNPFNKSHNILFAGFHQQIIQIQDQQYAAININYISIDIASIQSFLPLSSFRFNLKIQSQLFCLNLLYKFLIIITKTIFNFIEISASQYTANLEHIYQFFKDILVIQNIFVDQKSNQFYLVCLNNRFKTTYQNHTNIKTSKQHNFTLIQIEKQLLYQISNIFWDLFFHKPSQRQYENIQTSFLTNFLASMIKGQLNLNESIEILQSKQKRKSFINQKIYISANKNSFEKKHKKTNNLERYDDLNQNYLNSSQDVNFNHIDSSNISDIGIQNVKFSLKRKSVQRKLTSKRNTIDVLLQNYTQKDIPPSFQSKSQQKKGRLFQHQKIGRKKQRKSLSIYQNGNNNLKCHSSMNKSIIGMEQNQWKNLNDNFSFMRNSTSNKFNRKNVSKTLQIGHINMFKNQQERQNSENEHTNSKNKANSIIIVNTKQSLSKVHLKCSTQKISSIMTKQKQSLNKDYSLSTYKPSNIDQSQFMISKSKNRRYYHINNFISNTKDQSIQSLIKNQKKLLNQSIQNSKSKEKQLLNRSQQKALASFNREFCKGNTNKLFQQENKSKQTLYLSNKQTNFQKTNEKISHLLKGMDINSNFKNRYDENNQPDLLQMKKILLSQDKQNKNRQYNLSTFSPPKKKKQSKLNEEDIEKSTKFEKNKLTQEMKIDDKEFRSKFSLQINKNAQSNLKKELNFDSISKNKIQNIENITINKIQKPQFTVAKQLQLSKAVKFQIIKKQSQISNNNKNSNYKKDEKIDNEYLLDEQILIKKQKSKITTMGRSEKGLMNAAKKLNDKINNKNISIQEVFIQQQLMTQQQQQQRTLSHKQIKNEKLQTPQQRDSYYENDENQYEKNQKNNPSQNQQQQQKKSLQQQNFQQLVELISPIKPNTANQIDQPNLKNKNTQFNLFNQQQNPQASNLLNYKIQENKNQKQIKKENLNIVFKSKNISNNESINQLSMNLFGKNQNSPKLDSDDFIEQNNNLKQPITRQKYKDMHKLQQNEVQQAISIQRKPSISLKNKKNSENLIQKKSVKFATQNIQINQNISIPQNKQQNVNLNHKQLIKIKQPLQLKNQQSKKHSKRPTQISQDYEQELQQIKFTQTKNQLTFKNQKALKSQQPHLNVQQELISSKTLIQSSSKPPLPQQSARKANQSQVQNSSAKTNHQAPKLSPANSVKQKQNKRQNTIQSSIASSYGPNKTVKKIVEEYVFMINKIGQAVAKTPKVSKKIQRVTQWYVGVYFLYKRFLYERKKIEKYLKEGTPKLTRYQEDINTEEWKQYLKSPQRQALVTKVSEQNINIAKSIQKMQVKLLSRNIDESIKQYAAISQRTSRQSRIAIEAIIDQFDTLVEKQMLNDDEIVCHCTQMLNACLIIAQLDRLVENIIPISEFSKSKRTSEELQTIAQDLFDIYHDQ